MCNKAMKFKKQLRPAPSGKRSGKGFPGGSPQEGQRLDDPVFEHTHFVGEQGKGGGKEEKKKQTGRRKSKNRRGKIKKSSIAEQAMTIRRQSLGPEEGKVKRKKGGFQKRRRQGKNKTSLTISGVGTQREEKKQRSAARENLVRSRRQVHRGVDAINTWQLGLLLRDGADERKKIKGPWGPVGKKKRRTHVGGRGNRPRVNWEGETSGGPKRRASKKQLRSVWLRTWFSEA